MNKQALVGARRGVIGYEGLVAAIIHQAVFDVRFGNAEHQRDALDYFQSETYREHLGLLGLPVDWLPNVSIKG